MPEIMLGIVIVAVILLLVIFFRYVPIGSVWIRLGIRRPSDHYHPDRYAAAPHLSQAGGRHDHGHQGRP